MTLGLKVVPLMIEGGDGYCGWRAFKDSGDASGWAIDEACVLMDII